MPTERWREDLERTERDLEKICRRHPGRVSRPVE
jgi:hypothetical protein